MMIVENGKDDCEFNFIIKITSKKDGCVLDIIKGNGYPIIPTVVNILRLAADTYEKSRDEE